jgi:hypothetical protein
MSKPTGDTSRPQPLLPAGFVEREEAARISGIGITAWKRWEAQGKVTCGQWLMLPWGGRRRIFSIDGIQRMMRETDVSFPPPGTVERHDAARMLGTSERTFSTWEKQGRINCGRIVSIPGKPGQYKIYPVEALRLLKEQWERDKVQSNRQLEPHPDPDRPGIARVPIASTKHKGMAALIDIDALPVVQGKRWNWSPGSADTTTGGSVVWQGPATPLARIVMGVTDPNLLVGHLNGDRLDCRRENLIVRTRSESRRAAKRTRKWVGLEPYPDPDRPAVVRVPVFSDKHKGMEALIDAADLPLIRGKHWNWSPGKPGNESKVGTVVLQMSGTPKPSLGRIILGIDNAAQLVCHLNGDRLDCRRENLVVRTRAEVRRAAKKAMVRGGRGTSSRFKGVTRTESGRKWAATINVGGEYRNLGRFRSEIDAALAYDAALRELTGKDAPVGLNLPDPAEVERLRALEPVVEEDATWPPPGMVDRHEACRMFGVSLRTWTVWEQRGRITCGQYHPRPNDKPGICKLYPMDELERARVEIEKLGKPYADPDRPGVWRVPLRSYLTYREVLIDAADLPIVEGKNWNWSDRSDPGKTDGVVVLATTGRQAPLHRMIAGVTDPATCVSFVNGDPLDCRRANLVVRTLAETNHTSRKMETRAGKECSSRFKGVYHDLDRGKWLAQIRKGGVYQHIGRFDDELAAAQAYDDCARVWFGPHAYVNFPDRESTEANRIWAQQVLDGTAKKERLRRRRLKKLERKLKRAALEAKRVERARTHTERDEMRAAGEAAVAIGRAMARKLFGVSRSTWKRWRRFGWLPNTVIVDGKKVYRLDEIERRLRGCGKVVLPYPDPQHPGVYRVPLSGDTSRGREALIDADALPLVRTRRWRFAPADTGRGGEVQTMNPAENIRLHYVVMGVTGDATEFHIGHRNDDPLDCRRANLVVRTLTDTAAHKHKQATFCGRPCTSQFKGVCRPKKAKRWVATIKKDHVTRRLGTFHDEIAAAQAYDEAARELFGEHARLNFPDGVDAFLEAEAATRLDAPPQPSDDTTTSRVAA